MAWEERLASCFRLDEEGWARHANPVSGLSRMITGIPALALAAWSRVWIGGWWWLALAVVLAWLWLNPRLFNPPRDDRHWMTRGVLGEKIWVNRRGGELRPEPSWLPNLLTVLAAIGAIGLVIGLYRLDLVLTIAGGVLAWLAKAVFILRMVRFYEASVARRPELRYARPA